MSGSATRKATRTTTIRLTPDEADAVAVAAKARGMGPSTFARAATLRASGRPAPSAKRRAAGVDAEALARLTGELGRIGGLTKVLMMQARQGRVATGEVGRLAAELHELREAVLALRDAP